MGTKRGAPPDRLSIAPDEKTLGKSLRKPSNEW